MNACEFENERSITDDDRTFEFPLFSLIELWCKEKKTTQQGIMKGKERKIITSVWRCCIIAFVDCVTSLLQSTEKTVLRSELDSIVFVLMLRR
jgi:hypothetical protein